MILFANKKGDLVDVDEIERLTFGFYLVNVLLALV